VLVLLELRQQHFEVAATTATTQTRQLRIAALKRQVMNLQPRLATSRHRKWRAKLMKQERS
jgi:hypothetical protein